LAAGGKDFNLVEVKNPDFKALKERPND